MVQPQTQWTVEAIILIDDADQATFNTKLANRNYGPNNFTQGVSVSGNEPAQGYIAHMYIKKDDLADLLWAVNAKPRTWMQVRVREEHLKYAKAVYRNEAKKKYDLAKYKDGAWQTRSDGYCWVTVGETPLNSDTFLDMVYDTSNPQVRLLKIGASGA